MSDQASTPEPIEARTLVLNRIIDAPPARVFEAWTTPALVKQWFAPKPYTTPHVEIELKVGQSSIVVNQMGVTIKGMMIKVEGMAMAEVKAPMTSVKGDAMVMVKGGITMIN